MVLYQYRVSRQGHSVVRWDRILSFISINVILQLCGNSIQNLRTAQNTAEMLEEKQKHLLSSVRTKKITVSYHQSYTSLLEGVFARGDRRLCDVLLSARNKGLRLDGWDECFDRQKWLEAFDECGIDTAFYASRKREYDEILPWDHIDYCVSKDFLINENKRAHEGLTTKNCRQECNACGAACFGEGVCYEKR